MKPHPLPPPAEVRSEHDIRPVVALAKDRASLWLFIGVAILGALLLFNFLDGRRRDAHAPAVAPPSSDLALRSSSLPPLQIPLEQAPPPPVLAPIAPPLVSSALPLAAPPVIAPAVPPVAPTPAVTAPIYLPPSSPEPIMSPVATPSNTGAVLVFDRGETLGSSGQRPLADGASSTADGAAPTTGEAATPQRGMRLAQRATTVMQGTLIPAVLETALDSTQPGLARALVTRDIRGFDGRYVLIPRGSRLFGEYQSDVSPGQRRAFVRWTRLVRPDGVAIALESPTADRLGRAGVEGRVDNHFLARFGAAVLRTVVNVGAVLAGQSLGEPSVVIAVPSSVPTVTTAANSMNTFQPTLRVDAGSAISVFVARDLALSPVDSRREP